MSSNFKLNHFQNCRPATLQIKDWDRQGLQWRCRRSCSAASGPNDNNDNTCSATDSRAKLPLVSRC